MIHILNKLESRFEKLSRANIGIFIDNSGSTAGQILNVEKEFASYFSHNNNAKYVKWDVEAHTVEDFTNIKPGGMTEPACIFQNFQTLNIYENSDAIVLITDGQINQRDVEEFNGNISAHNNKSLAIGVLVSSKKNVDISVLAPLMNFPKSLLLQYVGGDVAKVLYNKGVDIKTTQVTKDDNVIQVSDILDLMLNDLCTKVPSDSIIVDESEEHIKFVKFMDFIHNKLPLEIYENINWESVCQRSKMNGRLNDVRELVNNLRNQEVINISNRLQNIINNNPINLYKQELIRKINDAMANNQDYTELSKELSI